MNIVSLHFNPNCPRWFFLIHNRIVNYKTAETWLLWMMKLLHKNAKYLTRKGSFFATQLLNTVSEHKRVSVSIAFAEGEAILVGRGPVALLSMLYTGPNLTSLTAGGRNWENYCSFSHYWYLVFHQNYFLLVSE